MTELVEDNDSQWSRFFHMLETDIEDEKTVDGNHSVKGQCTTEGQRCIALGSDEVEMDGEEALDSFPVNLSHIDTRDRPHWNQQWHQRRLLGQTEWSIED